MEIRPQNGPQRDFLGCPADIAVIGGAAGGCKTYSLLLEPLHYTHEPDFRSIFFRRTTPMLRAEGGAWDTSLNLYPKVNAKAQEQALRWTFPKGARFKMSQLEHESTIHDHQSAQYTLVEFDELVQFRKRQFFYMFSRNRSICPVKPYIRAATNPTPISDPIGGWVRELIDWWIDSFGFPIQRKSGILRYFIRDDDDIVWVDKDWRSPEGYPPKSFTFIPAKLSDNKILMEKNPEYEQNLNSMSRVDRRRLKDGNWDVREEDGMFEADWFGITDHIPQMTLIRYWDRAATEAKAGSDPDWTAGVLCGLYKGELYIFNMVHFRGTPAFNERKIRQTAEIDGKGVVIVIEQEPGASGKDTIAHYQTNVLKGFTVRADRPSGSKIDRCKPWCALAEFGHVKLKRGTWNNSFLSEAESFPNFKKDQIDAVSGAYTHLSSSHTPTVARMPI